MYNQTNRFRPSGFRQSTSYGGRPTTGYSRPNSFRRSPMRQKFFDPSFLIARKTAEGTQQAVTTPNVEKFVPINSFADFKIQDNLKSNIIRKGYKTPTPIQDKAIPFILEGRDVVGIANTGTGKTAAFLIPLINKILLDRNQKVLIIAPTRELAVQIQNELFGFNLNLNIVSALCIGGLSLFPQIQALRRNPNFVIGTPGRLKDLADTKKINFAGFTNIVLDEVDRMLDIGFFEEIKHIIFSLPRERQSLFFSATVPPKVQEVMRIFLNNPITVSVKTNDNIEAIKQEIVKLNGKQKLEVLHGFLLNRQEFSKVLVFGRTKHGMEKLSRDLFQKGIRAASIHGNKNQNQRQRALNDFKLNRVQVLIATDVASRGIDIQDVSHVINYDLPESYESYIHRIGRTGRANKVGVALTFIE